MMFGILPPRRRVVIPSEVQAVIDKMKEAWCPSPEGIQVLLRQPGAAVSALKGLLEEVLRHRRPPAIRSDAPLHAIFLLAALEAPEGLDLLLQILRRPQDFVEEFFGDILTECLSWAVARLARNRPEALLGLVRDRSLDRSFVIPSSRGSWRKRCFGLSGVPRSFRSWTNCWMRPFRTLIHYGTPC